MYFEYKYTLTIRKIFQIQKFKYTVVGLFSTVLCQKGLIDIFCHFLLFRNYDTTAYNTSPVKFLEISCAWK